MSLADIFTVLSERHPGFDVAVKGMAKGLQFSTPSGTIVLERVRVKDCATIEELRAYIDSLPAA